MARPQVADIARNARLEPQARMVDAYVRPEDPARSPLHELARALGNLEGSLASTLGKKDAEAEEAARLQGEADRMESVAGGMAEGVRQDVIPADASPHYVRGWKNTEGSLRGISLKAQFDSEYEAWTGKESGDPAAFDKFMGAFIARNMKENTDPRVWQGLKPHLYGIMSDGETKFAKDRSAAVYTRGLKATSAHMAQDIDSSVQAGKAAPEGTNYETIWGAVTARREAGYKVGMREADLDKEIIEVITAKALEHKDFGILGLLDREAHGRKGIKYSDLPDGRDAKLKTHQAIDGLRRRDLSDQREESSRQDKVHLQESERDAINHLLRSPHAPIPESVLQRGEKLDGNFRVRSMQWRKSVLEDTATEDPRGLMEVYKAVIAGGGTKAVTDAMEREVIRGPATLRQAFEFAEKFEKSPAMKQVLEGSLVSAGRATIKQRTQRDNIANPWEAEGLSDAGLAAIADMEFMLLEWAGRNPNASLSEQRGEQAKIIKQVLDGIGARDEPGQQPEYRRAPSTQQSLGADNPFTNEMRAPLPQPRPAGAPPLPNEGAARWFESLPTPQQQALAARAKAEGVSLEAKRDAAWNTIAEREEGAAPVDRTEPAPVQQPEQGGGLLDPIMKWLRGSDLDMPEDVRTAINQFAGEQPAASITPSRAVKVTPERQSFVQQITPHAVVAGKMLGIDPRIIVAQAALESNWGKAAPGNNFFGIKSHGKAGGQKFATHEVVGGKRVKITDSFRSYKDMGESVLDYARFLASNSRYRKMLQAGDIEAQLAALGASGYATDPAYKTKVGAIARSIKLES